MVNLNIINKVLDTTLHKMTCPFYNNGTHKGVDLVPKSTVETPNVLSFAAGTVIHTGNVKTSYTKAKGTITDCGTYVAIRHKDGSITRYQHLAYNSLKVSVGDTVKKGQVIGNLGIAGTTTGNSTGRHLHFDISFPTKPAVQSIKSTFYSETRYYVDPVPYLTTDQTLKTKQYRVIASALNVRTKPKGSVKRVVYRGTVLTVVSIEDGWAKLNTNEYVSADYLVST